MDKKIRGSCLCGAVRFEVEPPFIRAGHCHCQRCRKHSGTAVCTQARLSKKQFLLLQGESMIRVYGKREGAVKAFCVIVAQACLVATGRKAMKFPFAWELLTTIRASVRNIIRS
jgi:hypothetical protein